MREIKFLYLKKDDFHFPVKAGDKVKVAAIHQTIVVTSEGYLLEPENLSLTPLSQEEIKFYNK